MAPARRYVVDSIRRLRPASRSRSRSAWRSSAGCSSACWPTSSAASDDARPCRLLGRAVGRRQRDELVDGCAPARHATSRNRTSSSPCSFSSRSSSTGACRTSWVPVFLAHRRRRRDRAREHDQGDPRPRSADVRSDRRDARAVVPERSLGARPQRSTRRPRSSSHAGAHRGRARCSPAAPWRSRSPSRAVAFSSASTGCRTSSPGSPSAGPGSASARSRSAGASSCSAPRSSRRPTPQIDKVPASERPVERLGRSDVVEPALQRPDETPSTPRHPGKLDEPMRQRLRALEELELL